MGYFIGFIIIFIVVAIVMWVESGWEHFFNTLFITLFMAFIVWLVVSAMTTIIALTDNITTKEYLIPYTEVEMAKDILVLTPEGLNTDVVLDTNEVPTVIGDDKIIVYEMEVFDNDNVAVKFLGLQRDTDYDTEEIIEEGKPVKVIVDKSIIK